MLRWCNLGTKRVRSLVQQAANKLKHAFEGGFRPKRTKRRARHADRVSQVFARTQLGPFDDLILAAALRWQIDPFLLKGLLANESHLDPVQHGKRRYAERGGTRILISGGAMGIAQFTGPGIRAVNALRQRRRRRGEHVLRFDVDRAMQPQEAIPAAAELLAMLLGQFGRDGGITAYNSGVIAGIAVNRLGFWRARRTGKLARVGIYPIQGERFVINVLRRTNFYRKQAGLQGLDPPGGRWKPKAPRLAAKDTAPISTN